MIKAQAGSPVLSFGGKGGMVSRLKQHLPPNFDEFVTFFEPFCGSAVMALVLGENKKLVLNDADRLIANFYMVLSHPELSLQLLERAVHLPFHEALRLHYQKLLDQKSVDLLTPDIDLALAFYYSNRTSRSGIGGLKNSLLTRRGNLTKSVADLRASHDKLLYAYSRLQDAHIYSRDGIDLIPTFDRKDTFIYCDPPYHWDTRTTARYGVDMSPGDHERFVDTLLGLQNASVMVSGYDHPVYDSLVNSGMWRKVSFSVNTVSGTNVPREKTEVLWMNYCN